MSGLLDFQPLSVKTMGRAQMACLRCRAQKMKCSKDHPTCKSCATSKKSCQYPLREKKLVILESQFEKIKSRIQYLETELEKASANKDSSGNDKPETKPAKVKEELLEDNFQPFDNDAEVNSPEVFLAPATSRMFDNSLNSFLQRHTSPQNPDLSYTYNSRFFLEDPESEKPLTGMALPDKDYVYFMAEKLVNFLGYDLYLLDSGTFYNKVEDVYACQQNRDPLWICYILMVCAVGEQFQSSSPSGEVPGMRFFNPAIKIFNNYYEKSSLELIQLLLLFAFYQQGLNRSNGAFSFYGLAMRNSLAMGLHRKPSNPDSSPELHEKRRRIWWTCFMMNSAWFAILGQTIDVLINQINLGFPNEDPVNLNDKYDPELLTCRVKLTIVLDKILKRIYSLTRIHTDRITECLSDLNEFESSLPPRIRSAILLTNNRAYTNLYLCLNQIVIVATRPLVLSVFKGTHKETEVSRQVTQKCYIAAKTSIDILAHLNKSGWLSMFGFWDAQFLFSAILILAICNISGEQYPQIEVGKALNERMKQCGNFLAVENSMRLQELCEMAQRIRLRVKNKRKRDAGLPQDAPEFFKIEPSPQPVSSVKQVNPLYPSSTLINEMLDNYKIHESPVDNIPKDPPSANSLPSLTSTNQFGNVYHEAQPEGIVLNQDHIDTADYRGDIMGDAWNTIINNFHFEDSLPFGDDYLHLRAQL